MPSTYTLISSSTLSSSAASVTFSSIPATYTDLVLRCSVRHDGTGGNVRYVTVQFNSDTATNYSDIYLFGNGSTAISGTDSNAVPTDTRWLSMNGNDYTANTFSNSEIYIPNYLSTSSRPIGAYGVPENNASTANYIGAVAGLYRGTSAISSMVLKPQGSVGNFVSGSSFYLYGIKNS
jgi:hypothetical protein